MKKIFWLLGLVLILRGTAFAQTPYFTDFESGTGPEWSVSTTDNSQAYFTRFTGRFGNSPQVLTLTNLSVGGSYSVVFDFFVIDSWDAGSDFFAITVDGSQVFRDGFANYGGTQAYPGSPDEGRANFGFNSYLDAVYRSLEVSFVASNSTVAISFTGQGLQDINDESWGIDNVKVDYTTNLAVTEIRNTSLPDAGSTNTLAIDGFTVNGSRAFLASSANNAGNYILREAGGNGLFGDGDDVSYSLVPSYSTGKTVSFSFNNAPLQPGKYRFETGSGLLDLNSNPVTVFTRDFTVAHPTLGRIENLSNDTLATATPLSTTESPAASGFFTAFAVGTFSSTSDIDYWRFDAEAGDVLTVRVEASLFGVYPQLYLHNASGTNLRNVGGNNEGIAGFQNFVITSPGTYYLRVFSNNARSLYRMRVDQSRGVQMESEGNDSQASANAINLSFSAGLAQGKVVGALPADDAAGDFYLLGTMNVGNAISLNSLFPDGSSLAGNQLILTIQFAGNSVALTTNNTGTLNYTIVSNGVHYLRVESTNRTIRSQYLFNVALNDGVAPLVSGTSLPAEGTSVSTIIDRFSVSFSEEMGTASVTNTSAYELRAAGGDGTFGTADDIFYSLGNNYSGGLSASFTIGNGPLQPGDYRFTASTNLLDRASNQMLSPYVQSFSVTNLAGYVVENRSNDVLGLGTSMSANPGTNGDGTISFVGSFGAGSNPEFIASGHFNNDTNLDVVVANYSSGNISVLLNNGNSGFQNATNIATASGAVSVALGNFNNDTNVDLAVANYGAGSISILLGDGNGSFQIISNYPGFSNPYDLATADLNADGILDLAIPNYGNSTLSVLFGGGDGTFSARTNYGVGANPLSVAIGDLNADNKPDLVVANYNSSSLSMFIGNGDGSFQTVTNIPVGVRPRYVAMGEVTGDSNIDLVVLQTGDNTVSVLRGNGDGTFQARIDYNTITSDAYQLLLTDLNSDGRKDVVVPGYGNNTVSILLNDGAGVYTNLYGYGAGGNPISVTAGDYNNDGRTDLVFANHTAHNVSLWLGNRMSLLTESPGGSGLKTGLARGNLTSTGDVDYYQFYGTAGDSMMLAVEVPGFPAASSLYFRIERPDGGILAQAGMDYYGWGQLGPVYLSQSGTYIIRVSYNYDYQGEYRLRVTTARSPIQFETENNNSIAQANRPTLTLTNGHLKASVAGYLSVGDGAGDFFNLDNIGTNSTVEVGYSQPVSSGIAGVIEIYNSGGTVVATSAAGASNLVYTVPAGQGGVYYARVTAGPSGYSSGTETALRFDASDDSADLGNWFNYQTFTISMWISAAGSQNTYADILDNNHNTGINWVIQQDGNSLNNYYFGVADGGPSVPFSLTANQWQHLTITRDSSNVNRIYLDGVLVGTAAGTGSINYNGAQFLRIARWGSGGRHWNGSMDELNIWDRALSESEIATMMASGLAGTEPGLVGYWKFNEASGTTITDTSSAGRNGTLVNGPVRITVGAKTVQPPGLLSQYLLNFDVQDTELPLITGDSLPVDNSSVSNVFTRFSVNFSKDMDPAFIGLNRVVYSYNGHSYLISDSTSWAGAEAQAVSLGGHLATINSQAENDWINQTFSGYGALWIGLSDQAIEGNYVWTSGDPFSFSNWTGGNPDNSSGEDVVQLMTNGKWNDVASGTVRGVIEISSTTDSDSDGLVNAVDPYPNDSLNGFDLRAAGTDGLFDTTDDVVYNLDSFGYVRGLSTSFSIVDGPLQFGNYRFKVTAAVKDRSGNALTTPYVKTFMIEPVAGFVYESRTNNTAATATSLSINPTNSPDGSFSSYAGYGVGVNPHFLTSGQFNGDTNLDLVVANYGSSTISFLAGNGNGTFQTATNFAAPTGPLAIAVGNFDNDTNLDLAVANYGSARVTIMAGDGAGNFQSSSNYVVPANPYSISAGDFNGDSRLDLATANYNGHNVSVLLADTNGAFLPAVNYPTGNNAHGVATGDVNGDGRLDLAVANYGPNTISILLGNGDGTFQSAVNLPASSNPRSIVMGRINSDTNLDLAVLNPGDNTMSIFIGNGDGTFQPRVNYSLGSSDPYQIILSDFNSDGSNDVVVASYGNNRLITLLNQGNGTFGGLLIYPLGGNPISVVAGDYNSDGRVDLATANYTGNSVSILLGNKNSQLEENPVGSGIRTAAGRGNLSDTSDWDYWSFSGVEGDRLSVAVEIPGNPGASSLSYQIERPDGGAVTSFSADYSGWGQSVPAILPVSGTYTLRVTYNYDFQGEYRFRVTLARPPIQLESENNNTTGEANTVGFAFSPGHQKANLLGYISVGDGNGDYYRLGNLSAGTSVILDEKQPSTSPLSAIIGIYNSGGGLVTNSAPGATNLTFDIPGGGDGSYFARITAEADTTGIFSQYQLDIDLADTLPPSVTSDSFPAEGTIASNIVDRFSLSFSEDMTASNVINSANYELRNAGADEAFGTTDDSVYALVNSPAYSTGLSASYFITGGPLQPGKYQFTAQTNLTDRAGNFLASTYVKNFRVINLNGFILESRSNDSYGTPTSFSLNFSNAPDGSFSSLGTFAVGTQPHLFAAGRLNNDTNLDLVVPSYNGGTTSIMLGNGDGTFQLLTNFLTAAGPVMPAIADFNGDSIQDIAMANYTANSVTVLFGNGNGTFQTSGNYAVGSQPYFISTADLNADGELDVVTANVGSANVSVLLGNGDGTFQDRVNYAAGAGAETVVIGDVNKDGKPDLITANGSAGNLALLLGNGDGTFAAPLQLPVNSGPRSLTISDFNKDSNLDLVAVNGGDNTISILFGNGDGSFQPRVNFGSGTADSYQIITADFNNDSWPDLAVSGFNNHVVNIFYNLGNGSFGSPAFYSSSPNPIGIVAGDFNNDLRLDIAVANYSGASITVLLGNFTQPLAANGSELRSGTARGNLSSNSDVDYWSFSASAQDRLLVNVENVGSPGASGLCYGIYRPDGGLLTDFCTDYYGRGQKAVVLPVTGTYRIRVANNYVYSGEYRLRVTLAKDPTQFETEDNNTTGQANSITLTLNGGHQTATILGAIDSADGSGDFFRLGTLSSNTVVALSLKQPPGSGFADVLEVLNSAGTVVAASQTGASNLNYTVPTGGDGAHYARIRGIGGSLPATAPHPTGSSNALFYPGGNSYSEVLIDLPENAMTLSLWFRTFDPGAPLFSVMGGGHDRHLFLSGGNIYSRIYSAGTIGSSGLSLADGAWHYVVFTYGSPIGGNKIYVDGVEVVSGSKAQSDFTWQDRMRIGYSDDAPTRYFNGELDEVRIWNSAFTPADVLLNWTNNLAGNETGLVGYWRFNEGTGSVSVDLTTNAHNATIYNSVWFSANRPSIGLGIFAQYLLTLDTSDATPLSLASVTLPNEGSSSAGIIDRFTVNFSKDIDPAINLLNRSIQFNGGHAYLFTDSSMSWPNAEAQARSLGGHLVTINDSAENAWLLTNFGTIYWIGFSDEAQEGNFSWSSGEPVSYTNWNSGEPNNSGNEDYASIYYSNGKWVDEGLGANRYGIIEVSGVDSDGDGLADTLDPYPTDPFNVFDLRAAGTDGIFDTGDDQIYKLNSATYSSGVTLNFTIVDGPLQAGNYRFRVSTSLRDRFGNTPSAPLDRYFTVNDIPGFVLEDRSNNSAATATPLNFTEDPAGLNSVSGRGNLFNNADADYWSFSGVAGEIVTLATEIPGFPGATQLYYQVFRPDGSRIFDFYPAYTGEGQTAPFTLPTTGTYTVAVSYNYQYYGEYRLRLSKVVAPIIMETEDNGSIAAANSMTLATSGESRFGSIAGYIRYSTDLDYVNLGTLTNGSTVFLSARIPGNSQLLPVVSIYSAGNFYQAEAGSGRSTDGVAEVRITSTGNYYAVIRGGEGTGGIQEQYLLDVQVLPTGSVSFPNMQVTSITPPSGNGIQSGQLVNFSFSVQNVGSLATPGANWSDRVVMSLNTTLGDSDDIPLGIFPHSGALNPGDSYTVNQSATLPEGISGNYYLIVQTDSGNGVNEFVLEGDNITVSGSTFAVTRANYADLKIEGLSVTGPDTNNVFSISWNTANRGNLSAPSGFRESFLVRNQTTGAILVNTEQVISNALAVNATLPHTASVTTTNPGNYLIQVTTDLGNDIYEFDAISHASAEQNTFTTSFQIIQYFNIAALSNPTGAGTLTGAGIYPSGSIVTLNAVANTNLLPYQFVNWTEGGTFQSVSTNFVFTATRDRQIIANFVLPSYQIGVSNNPVEGGLVTGAGTYFYGTTNVLTAYANPGYRFTNWTESGSVVGTNLTLTTVVYSNRFVAANYVEANTFHDVTTATLPIDLVAVTGAGNYTNGQSAQFSAPLSVTNAPNVYTFRRYTLNSALFGTNATFNKTFSTLDPTNMLFVAEYDSQSILPLLTNVTATIVNPVPLTTNFVLNFQFNRSMKTNVEPVVRLTNSAVTLQAVVPTGGVWSTSAVSNDTFSTAPITFSSGMDGTHQVFVSGAVDLNNASLASTNVTSVVVDATPPVNPTLSLISSNASSAVVGWSGYVAPGDLNAFRIFVHTNNFSSSAGLTAVSGLNSSARQFNVTGLELDRSYFVGVAAIDVAGNSSATITPLQIILPSTVPPPVTIVVTPTGPSSARVSWTNYNTASLFGFAGFRLFHQETNFTSVVGLSVRETLGTSVRFTEVTGLDRSKIYRFAVVGFSGTNGFNPNVTTATWSDPYAGTITTDTTIGGEGQNDLAINQSIVVSNNATLTILPGTTLRFAVGTGITIQQGRLTANGTALDPIILTSANDVSGQTPAAGDWNGVVLESGASNSVLRHVWIKYGAGLSLNGVSPTVDAFTALNNSPAGLALSGSASLTTSNALLLLNNVGVQQSGAAQLNIRNSVIKNNGTNALADGSATLIATQNWWGTTVSADIDANNSGTVNSASFLTFEPVLTPALGTVGNVTQVGNRDLNLRFACRTADSMRVSEDSSFAGVFFAPFASQQIFQLSEGGGQKTIYAQFRSVTGHTNGAISIAVQYVTAGPVIQSFSLNEGQLLERPLIVNGSATAALGMSAIEFYADNILQSSAVGGNYSQRFDVRNFVSGLHRVKLLARDNSGNFATIEKNIYINLAPPPAPVITIPGSNLIVTTNRLNLTGTAEPLIDIRVTRNGQTVGNTTANAAGNFSVTNISLVEGLNSIVAAAFDSVGSSGSAVREVQLDTGSPAQLIMDTPIYRPGIGLTLSWQFPTTGERATSFKLFWHTAPFASTNQATGQSLLSSSQSYTAQGLANGTYYFGVIGYDSAGNASPLSVLVTFNYDASAPSFNITYDKVPPVGVGLVHLNLISSEALSANPSLTLAPFGSTPVLIALTNTSLNTYEGVFNVTATTPSGRAQWNIAAQDLSTNIFNGAPTGADFVIDVTPPKGSITTAPIGPVQTTSPTNVVVNLTLSEAPKSGTTPGLTFTPPTGSPLTVSLTGSDTNWTGPLALNSAMGSGFGRFAMSVSDALDNVGTNLLSGSTLEIYNTALPSAPPSTSLLIAQTLSAGKVRLSWNSVSNAEIYRLYREPGTTGIPTLLVADNITGNAITNIPATDGSYRYAVSSSRRGSESIVTNFVVAVSDRTPPLAPTNVTVQLVSTGIQIAWQQPGGGEAVAFYNVYRNGTYIRSMTSVTPVIDYPPRGVMNYVVAAVDAAGNETNSTAASIELLVGAVNNLQALINIGQPPYFTWTSDDSTAVGFNIYRNGAKVNNALITALNFTDTQYSGSSLVQYAVRAVNASSNESVPRTVDVHRMDLTMLINSAGRGSNDVSFPGYFDQYQVTISNITATGSLPLRQLELRRTITGLDPLNITRTLNQSMAAGTVMTQNIVTASAPVVDAQAFRIRAIQETDIGGSSVIYQQFLDYNGVGTPSSTVEISANQTPLAGGLTPFQVRVFNRGTVPMDMITIRNSGAEPGDVYIRVKNAQGQEVSRTEFRGTPTGTIFLGDGRGYVRIAPGGSSQFTVPNVLVPESLATNGLVTFEAVVDKTYYRIGTAEQVESGPLRGSMISGLIETEYYGSLQTDQPGYANEVPMILTGQAIDRVSGLPRTNTALKIGFSMLGYRWYRDVTTDATGNYSYTYNPTPGLSGTLKLWAAHPLVFDILNQAEVEFYRLYASPQGGDLRMSKNDSVDFSISVINPGELSMTNFTSSFEAYTVQGTNRTPITTITGGVIIPPDFGFSSKQTRTVTLQLNAATNAPDTALVIFTLTSAEGAAAKFTGYVTLLPAVPVVTVVSPTVGYVETSLDRGTLLSRTVTIANRGLRELQGIELFSPTNVPWMSVNLPVSPDGKIRLPDLAVGESNSFQVVFAPPANVPLAYYQDNIRIKGTNSPAEFLINVYALVTSDKKGSVQFHVDNILGQNIANATIRLRNLVLQQEITPAYTDTNGLVTITNLQEGQWSWQATAPGHGSTVGSVEVIPNQIVQVTTRLSKSLVTVNFNVVPVPYTDKYEIKIEQTFETHVPAPVLVIDPAYKEFKNVTPGYEANFIVTAKNHGLIEMTDLTITGSFDGHGNALTPLITYVPVLLPQQVVEIPFRFTHQVAETGQQTVQNADDLIGCFANAPGILSGFLNADVAMGLAAIFNAQGRCVSDSERFNLGAALAATIAVAAVLDTLSSAEEFIASYVGAVVACVVGNLLPAFDGPNAGPGGGSGSGFGSGDLRCFAAGTMVTMADGTYKPIEKVQPNDLVRTGTTSTDVTSIVSVHTRVAKKLRVLELTSPGSKNIILETTDEHLLWVDGKGWMAASTLESGDWVFTENGSRARITASRSIEKPTKVYTFKNKGDGAFYANGILVHDLCGAEQTTSVKMEVSR